jgi:hypothetical protein
MDTKCPTLCYGFITYYVYVDQLCLYNEKAHSFSGLGYLHRREGSEAGYGTTAVVSYHGCFTVSFTVNNV